MIWPCFTRVPDAARNVSVNPLPWSGDCNTGAPMLLKRRALMEPARRRVFWITPRVARTVETVGAATVLRGCGRKAQTPARTSIAPRTYIGHSARDPGSLTGLAGALRGLSGAIHGE